MKSRRGLQISVAVLSLILLVCLAALAAVSYLNSYLSFLPKQIAEFGNTLKDGLQTVSDVWEWLDWSTPALFFGVPSGTLLLAVILILIKNKDGKDAKNVAGCIFALIGVAALVVFSFIYAKNLYAESALMIAYCVNGGVLALFVLFVALALGVKPKKVAAAQATEPEQTTDEQPAEQESRESEQEVTSQDEPEQEIEQEVEPQVESNREQEMADEIARLQEELKRLQAESEQQALEQQLAREQQQKQAQEQEPKQQEQPDEETEEETPATQYVPHPDVTIHDIVMRTYGRHGSELSYTTLAKIKKVRELYEAKAITEQEYIKLINKYLGF